MSAGLAEPLPVVQLPPFGESLRPMPGVPFGQAPAETHPPRRITL